MKKKINLKIIGNDLECKIIGVFPIFLLFYLFSLFLSAFLNPWRLLIHWPNFHLLMAVYSAFYFFKNLKIKKTKTIFIAASLVRGVKNIFKQTKNSFVWFENIIIRLKKGGWFKENVFIPLKRILIEIIFGVKDFIIIPLRKVLIKIWQKIKYFYFWLKKIIIRLKKKDWLKIFIIIAILISSLWREIAPLDFVVLTYGLLSFLFIFNSQISAIIALTLLIFCPFLLIFKKSGWAEIAAIYTYYFLIITVSTKIREIKIWEEW